MSNQQQGNKSTACAVVREDTGLSIVDWSSHVGSGETTVHQQSTSECRVLTFSKNGAHFAYCDATGVHVIDMNDGRQEVMLLPLPRTIAMRFSSNGELLITWENYTTKHENVYGVENLRIFSVPSGKMLYSLLQRDTQTSGLPQCYAGTNEVAVLTGNTINFFSEGNFEAAAGKLHVDKMVKFELSPNSEGKQSVACFIKGTKGAPASVRIFPKGTYSSTDLIANKSFYKADSVSMDWNPQGNALLVTTLLESDSTNKSYYGEQNLQFLSTRGDGMRVGLSREGPIHCAKWSPDSKYFCVVYGYMPSKAGLFNHKCEQIYEFSQTPRNECYFNAQGNLLALCGFGNLRACVEVYDLETKKQVSEFEPCDTTYFEWCSDGERFVTATTTPRLRVNNMYKVWDYVDGLLCERKCEKSLYQVTLQPLATDMSSKPQRHASLAAFKKPAAQAAYVPPAFRNNPQYRSRKLSSGDEDNSVAEKNVAKKNPKKKNKKKSVNGSFATHGNLTKEQQDGVTMVKYLLSEKQPVEPVKKPGLSEKEKKLKKLRKNVVAIEKLKLAQEEGKVLEVNQLAKLATEAEVKAELGKLEAA